MPIPTFGTAKSRLPSPSSVPPQVNSRLESLDDVSEAAEISADAAFDTVQANRAEVGDIEGRLALARQQPQVDDAAVAEIEDELARGKRKLKGSLERSSLNTSTANDALYVFNRTAKYARANPSAPLAKVPKGKVRDIGEIDADISKVEECLMPFEDALADAIRQVDAEAAGDVMVHLDHNGRPDVTWPIRAVNAEPVRQDSFPAVFNPLPWIIRAHRDEIIATIKSKLAKAYDGHLALSTAEKRKRLDALKAERLDADRIRCDKVWADYRTGGSLIFPRDVDPRAVLGIEGPVPPKDRD